MRTQHQNYPMSDDQLARVAPSIFATTPWAGMSARYSFIPTINVVRKMRTEGFVPFAAQESRSRVPGKADFTKHVIRFRSESLPTIRGLGGVTPELMLTNAHDGTSTYRLNAGLFRFVCFNGLVIGDSFASFAIRHAGNVGDIIDATYEVISEFPKVLGAVENFAQMRLEAPQQLAFAQAALTLKYEEQAPISAQALLQVNRQEDREPTLWNTYNTVQENLIGGGQRGIGATGRRLRTRPVNSIAENTRLNKALWTLADSMRTLAHA